MTSYLPPLPPIVGICGPARAGKDTLAKVLIAMGYDKDSFAAPIRQFVAAMCGVTLEQLEDIKDFPSDALNGKTPRYAMQTLGTEWGRSMIDSEVWVNYLCRRSTGRRIVVPDVRFDNEAKAIVKMGGAVFRITRPGVVIVESGHSSEAGISETYIDHTFVNDGTVQDLEDQLQELMLVHFGVHEV